MNEEFLNDNNLSREIEDNNIPLLGNDNENIGNHLFCLNLQSAQLNSQNQNNKNENLVEAERKRITEDMYLNLIPTKIVGLKKTYWFCCKKNIRAVNNIYFCLENNEKFGLLEFNCMVKLLHLNQ